MKKNILKRNFPVKKETTEPLIKRENCLPIITKRYNFKDILGQVGKLEILMEKSRIDPNLKKYLPGIMQMGYQGMIYNIIIKS